MIMCVLLCYPVSIRIYYQQGGLFLVLNFTFAICEQSLIGGFTDSNQIWYVGVTGLQVVAYFKATLNS